MNQSVFAVTEAFNKGLEMRKRWLGEAHVARSMAAAEADPFMVPIQQYATESCWGQLWSRPTFDLKTRSLLTLAILGTLNMREEIQLHTGAAIRNGITKEEISEVLLHVAVYAGVPRGISAFGAAKQAIDKAETQAAAAQP